MASEWLGSYQTLVVGLIGFGGVIVTLLANAKLARAQRNEEREHERRALRAALIAELRINRTSLATSAAAKEATPPEEKASFFIPTDPVDEAYRSFLPRMGLLTKEEVRTVMEAYLSLRSYERALLLLGEPAPERLGYVKVPPNNVQLVAKMERNLLDPIDRAIEVMEK
jgi:hypothetical protein